MTRAKQKARKALVCSHGKLARVCEYCDNAKTIAELQDHIQTLVMQLAGCGVAALQNTEKSARERITKDNPYWCASYQDVCNAVDREMSLRSELATVRGERDELIEALTDIAGRMQYEKDMHGLYLQEELSLARSNTLLARLKKETNHE